jgi:hypothetical protein
MYLPNIIIFNECPVVFVLQLHLLARAGFSLADFSILKMEAIRFSETSVHAKTARLHIPEYGILHSHRRQNLKAYIIIF